MADFIADIPTLTCWIRDEHLYDLERGHGDFTPAQVFGLQSIEGRALLFMCMTSGGAIRDHTPISAFTHQDGHEAHIPLEHLQLWNVFSYHPAVLAFDYLKGLRCRVTLKDLSWHWGSYQFTVDWYGNQISEAPGEGGHKSAHVIALDCGCYTAQPNHRVLWREPSFITDPLDPEHLPRYRTNTRHWIVEQNEKWVTEDDDRHFYMGREVP